MEKIGINLQIRSMENNIVQSLEQFPDVPIETKRVVIEKIYEKILRDSDLVTKQEMVEYEKLKTNTEEKKGNESING